MRLLFSLLFIFIFSTNTIAQKVVVNVFMQNKIASPKSDTIYFDINKRLTWSDFKGVAQPNHFGGAVTASGFAFGSQSEYDGEKITIDIGIITFFLKSTSWKKPEINSAFHLLHEQNHFDITRLGSEKFMSEIKKANFTKSNYQQLITTIFNRVYRENDELQNKYDLETNHSINTKKQEEWNQWVADQLLKIQS
ncbi:MAG: hypothetical protein ABI266_06930 [Ginsengibacter sp.]